MSSLSRAAEDFAAAYDQLATSYQTFRLRSLEADQELVGQIGSLEVQLAKAMDEVDTQRDAATARQERIRSLEREMRDLRRGGDQVVVLLDGDGCIFTTERLLAGRVGGGEAARMILAAIKEEAANQGFQAENVILTLFLNRGGLASVLNAAAGVSPDVFADFLRGFSGASELFTWVDVGDRKEAADEKIRAHMRLYGSLERCRMLVCGISHDSGYASILNSFKTSGFANKVRLLQGYDFVPKVLLEATDDEPLVIPDLFRRDKLPPRPIVTTSPSNSRSVPALPPTVAAPAPSPETPPSVLVPILPPAIVPSPRVAPPPPPVVQPVSDQGYPLVSYKRDGALPGGVVLTERYQIKELASKPCNNFYLGNGCSWGDSCVYAHDIEITADVLRHIRKSIKVLPCTAELDYLNGLTRTPCQDPWCFRGHACPQGAACPRARCKFEDAPGTHPSSDPELAAAFAERRVRDNKDLETGGGMGYAHGYHPAANGRTTFGKGLKK